MSTVNREILSVIRALEGDQQKYKRERARAVKAIVPKIYSLLGVTAATKLLPKLRFIPEFALDLTTADVDGALWDFYRKVMRDRAMKKVREERGHSCSLALPFVLRFLSDSASTTSSVIR